MNWYACIYGYCEFCRILLSWYNLHFDDMFILLFAFTFFLQKKIICIHLWIVGISWSQVWLNKNMGRKESRFHSRHSSWECSWRPHQAVVLAKTSWDGWCWYVNIQDLFQSDLSLCFINSCIHCIINSLIWLVHLYI